MGTRRARPKTSARVGHGIADALFPATRQRVLGLLFGQPDRRFSLKELIELARSGTGAVQRELDRLGGSGIISVTSVAGRKYLQANRAAPVFEELRGLIDKTTGVAGRLRDALESNGDRVQLALLYGSVAKGTDTASSDIDVLIVSDDLTLEAAYAVFDEAERSLGRKVNPTLYTREEFRKRRRDRNAFLEKVLSGARVVLVGSEDAVAA